MNYLQCRLSQDGVVQVAWIPESAAKIGNRVELITNYVNMVTENNHGFWLIESVGDVEQPAHIVRPLHSCGDWQDSNIMLD